MVDPIDGVTRFALFIIVLINGSEEIVRMKIFTVLD